MKAHFVRGLCVATTLALLSVPSVGLANSVTIAGSNAGDFHDPGPSGSWKIKNDSSGAGSSKFTWGTAADTRDGSRNWMEYKPAGGSFTTQTETDFKLGTLTYFNGTTKPNTTPETVGLQIALNLTAPGVVSQLFDFNLDLISTDNTKDPIASADYVKFPTSFPGTTITIDNVDYTLEILGFRNADSNGFVGVANPNEFHVKEGYKATAELWARVTARVPDIGAVPEPASIVSAAVAGAAGLGLMAHRRRRKEARD